MWGPTTIPEALKFNGAPYAPFSKGDKLGKAADWSADPAKEARDQKRAQSRGFRDPYHAYGASASSFFTADDQENSLSFSVVDSVSRLGASAAGSSSSRPSGGSAGGKKTVLRTRGGAPAGRGAPSVGATTRAMNSLAVSNAQAAAQANFRGPPQGNRGPRTMTIGSATLHNRRGGNRQQNDKTRARKPSVPIGNDWTHIQTNGFSELQKLSFAVEEPEVVGEYGYVPVYDKKMDKLLGSQKLRRVDVTDYNVSSSEDPVLERLAKQESSARLRVFATDAIVALLMCAPKSNNPWDVIVTKRGNEIFFDKRDNSAIDLPAVDENAAYPPADIADTKIDSAPALALEASYINLNFEANVVLPEKHISFSEPNPFSNGQEPASAPLLPKGYVYKRFNLESNPEAAPVDMYVRMEIDAAVERDRKMLNANVFALNEYGGSKPLEWKDRFVSSKGAIVTAEMKNNLNKLSQWTARSLLAGVPVMKIGFVSRTNAKDNQSHEIVYVLTQNPVPFATQLNLSLNNGWGIIKSLVDVFAGLDDGKYVLLRDPVAPSVAIYGVPSNTTFEESQ